jgi:hypothetical protein
MTKIPDNHRAQIFASYQALRKEGRDRREAITILGQSDYSYLSRNDIKQIIKDGKRRG